MVLVTCDGERESVFYWRQSWMVVVDKDTGQWQEEENEKKRKGTQDKIEVTCVRVGAGALPPLRNLWSERKKGTEKTRERPTIITFCIDCFSPTIYSNNQFLDLFQPMIFSIIQCFDLGFNDMDQGCAWVGLGRIKKIFWPNPL